MTAYAIRCGDVLPVHRQALHIADMLFMTAEPSAACHNFTKRVKDQLAIQLPSLRCEVKRGHYATGFEHSWIEFEAIRPGRSAVILDAYPVAQVRPLLVVVARTLRDLYTEGV